MKNLLKTLFVYTFLFSIVYTFTATAWAKDQTDYVTGQQNWEMHVVEGNNIPVKDKSVFVTVYFVDDTALVSSFANLAEKGATVTVVLSTTAYSSRNLWNSCMAKGCKVYWNKNDKFDNVTIFSYKGLELSDGEKKKEYLLATGKFYLYLARSERIN